MERVIPFVRPLIVRDDLEAVLRSMVTDSIGTGEIAARYAQELATQQQCYGGVVFRDLSTAIMELYEICARRRLRTLLLPPLVSTRWMETARKFDGLELCYAPLIPDTIIADYAPGLAQCDAVLVETTLGHPPDYKRIVQSGKVVIEHIGAGVGGKKAGGGGVGEIGRVVVMELEAEHILTCGGGVAVLCRNKEDYNALARRSKESEYRSVIGEINAALGMAQLKRLPQFIERRRALEKMYARRISAVDGLRYQTPFGRHYTPHSFPIRCRDNRKKLQKFARAHGVETRVAFTASVAERHLDELGLDDVQTRYLREVVHQTLLFPLYPQLSKADSERIERVIANLL